MIIVSNTENIKVLRKEIKRLEELSESIKEKSPSLSEYFMNQQLDRIDGKLKSSKKMLDELVNGEEEINRIKDLQYKNLRECINKNIVRPILGELYHNTGADVYQSDELMTEAVRRRYEKALRQRDFYRYFLGLLGVLNIIILFEFILYIIKMNN